MQVVIYKPKPIICAYSAVTTHYWSFKIDVSQYSLSFKNLKVYSSKV